MNSFFMLYLKAKVVQIAQNTKKKTKKRRLLHPHATVAPQI